MYQAFPLLTYRCKGGQTRNELTSLAYSLYLLETTAHASIIIVLYIIIGGGGIGNACDKVMRRMLVTARPLLVREEEEGLETHALK